MHQFENRLALAFESVAIGNAESKLIDVAGAPSYTTDGTRWVEPHWPKSEEQMVPGCKTEYWYYSGIFLVPSKWSFCFDEDDKLVDKYHWVSW